jgi:flagellar protein FliS
MNYARSVNTYRNNAIHSASPGQLVLMLYDGALRFMDNAVRGFDEPNFITANEQIHNNLIKTQAIITELQATLDFDQGGEIARNLYRIYEFMQDQLRTANRDKAKEPIHVVQKLLSDIRDAWAQMLDQQTNKPPSIDRLAVTC